MQDLPKGDLLYVIILIMSLLILMTNDGKNYIINAICIPGPYQEFQKWRGGGGGTGECQSASGGVQGHAPLGNFFKLVCLKTLFPGF